MTIELSEQAQAYILKAIEAQQAINYPEYRLENQYLVIAKESALRSIIKSDSLDTMKAALELAVERIAELESG